AQLLLGAASGSVLVLFALPLGLGLKLPPNVQTLTLPVFILAGVGFLGARMSSFAGDLLAGLRRFDLANLVGSFGAVVRACGLVLLLEAGDGLLAVAGGCPGVCAPRPANTNAPGSSPERATSWKWEPAGWPWSFSPSQLCWRSSPPYY